MSEVDNNLGASFVILGLLTSLKSLDQEAWLTFTNQTLFLRPHVQSLVYCLRVLPSQRAAVEQRYNDTFYTYGDTQGTIVPRGDDTEYAPVILQSFNLSAFFLDIDGYPILRGSIDQARGTGNFSLSPPYFQLGHWRMGSFLAHYGNVDPTTLTTVEQRNATCVGYVVTGLNVEEVFGSVISRCSIYTGSVNC